MGQSEGAWIAVGVSALFVVVGLAMHRIFVRILKTGAIEPGQEKNHE
jgi:hypothetical protein